MRYNKDQSHRRLTQCEELIISDVVRHGGEVQSVWDLADRNNLHYGWARHCVKRLRAAGLLDAQRVQPADSRSARGRRIVLRVPEGLKGYNPPKG